MIGQRWGRIINVSGLAARQTGAIVGSVRNVAVAALTKNLADELGAYGINVTVVHPGLTRTEKTAGVVAAQAESLGLKVAELEARMGSRVAIGRIVDAAEVADVIVFLCSEEAPTGAILTAGGGAFAMARIVETEGVYLGEGALSVEEVRNAWAGVADETGQKAYLTGGEQTQKFFRKMGGG